MSKNTTTPTSPADQELTVKDISQHFQVRTELVREWLSSGKLRGYKLGKYWRTSWSAIDAFKSSCRGV